MTNKKNRWSLVYKKAILPDGSLLFPQKLTAEFLENAKRTMGTYLFANQYLNEILPDENRAFKKEWFKYYQSLPKNRTTFAFIDPAISQQDGADYTGIVVQHVDEQNRRFVEYAARHRMTPSEIVDFCFKINDQFKPNVIGVEDVAFQKALIYMLTDEMKRRDKMLPIAAVKPPTDKTKEMKIHASLGPRFEWGQVFLNQGLFDLEIELLTFPRGAHDDLIDALASMDSIVYAPRAIDESAIKPRSQSDPRYETWYINQLAKNKRPENQEQDF